MIYVENECDALSILNCKEAFSNLSKTILNPNIQKKPNIDIVIKNMTLELAEEMTDVLESFGISGLIDTRSSKNASRPLNVVFANCTDEINKKI